MPIKFQVNFGGNSPIQTIAEPKAGYINYFIILVHRSNKRNNIYSNIFCNSNYVCISMCLYMELHYTTMADTVSVLLFDLEICSDIF
jgi:hypothetical protein